MGGNTRLAGLIRIGHDPKIWVVQAPGWDYDDSEESIGEEIEGGLSDNKTLIQIAKKHDAKGYYHIQDMIKSLRKELNMGVKIEMEHTDSEEIAKEIAMDHLWENPSYYSKLKKMETNEVTGASSSGAYVGAMTMTKGDVEKIHNSKLNEAIDSGVSAGAAYDVPLFGANPRGGRKDPLKIDGPESIGKGRAVKDKNFPKWGGPGGVFIKIKEKCKKFPYCNQGDINALKIFENEVVKKAITNISKTQNISENVIKNILIYEYEKSLMNK